MQAARPAVRSPMQRVDLRRHLLRPGREVPRRRRPRCSRKPTLDQLGLDSLALMEFVFAVEDRFDVRIPEERLDPRQAGVTLEQLATLLDEAVAAKAAERCRCRLAPAAARRSPSPAPASSARSATRSRRSTRRSSPAARRCGRRRSTCPASSCRRCRSRRADFDAARRGRAVAPAARPRRRRWRLAAARAAASAAGLEPGSFDRGAARRLLGQRHGRRRDLRGDLPHRLRRAPPDAADQRRHDDAERAGRRARARLRRPRRRARLRLRLRLVGSRDRRGDAGDPRRLDRRRHRRRQRVDADARACSRAGRRCGCWRRSAAAAGDAATVAASCRPFAADRAGFALGEAAAAFVLESRRARAAAAARRRGSRCSPATRPTATACTSPSPTPAGQARAMRAALADAGLAAGDIGYLNAHGTATPAGDAAEAASIAARLRRARRAGELDQGDPRPPARRRRRGRAACGAARARCAARLPPTANIDGDRSGVRRSTSCTAASRAGPRAASRRCRARSPSAAPNAVLVAFARRLSGAFAIQPRDGATLCAGAHALRHILSTRS